jgi:oxygen-independent coproporphyrinogen-3 oxidase
MLLYIHIPFCDSKCSYCAFNSYVDKFHLKKAYMQALEDQLRFELKRFKAQPKSIETLFIGGGTPSTIAPELYHSIFKLLTPYLAEDAELTSEANPNSASREWLQGMYDLGLNRISFGVQSFNEKKLKLLNRAHTPKMAIEAILHADNVGFKNISLDLIYATLGDTKALLEYDLKTAFSLPINHLSAYALTIEEGTLFEKKPQMAKEQLVLTEWIFQTIQAHGFQQYEISNFGNYRSKHNLGYWQYKDYIGGGAGAVGKYQNQRFYPNPDIEAYIADPLKIRIEHLEKKDQEFEKLFLGFRSCIGVEKELLNDAQKIKASVLEEEQKLEFKNGLFYNTDYLLADEIALYLTEL